MARVRTPRLLLSVALVVVMASCAQEPTCNIHAQSTSVPVGTTQALKVDASGLSYVDFAGAVWIETSTPVRPPVSPPIGTDMQVTLVERDGASGKAVATLQDGSTHQLSILGCK